MLVIVKIVLFFLISFLLKIGEGVFFFLLIHWLADLIKPKLAKVLIKTRYDLATWVHYTDRCTSSKHRDKTPYVCQDDLCNTI